MGCRTAPAVGRVECVCVGRSAMCQRAALHPRLDRLEPAISGPSRHQPRTTAVATCGSSTERAAATEKDTAMRRRRQARCRNFLQSAGAARVPKGSSRPITAIRPERLRSRQPPLQATLQQRCHASAMSAATRPRSSIGVTRLRNLARAQVSDGVTGKHDADGCRATSTGKRGYHLASWLVRDCAAHFSESAWPADQGRLPEP